MNRYHKQRIYYVILLITGSLVATGLILFALQQNINVFLMPKDVGQAQITGGQTFKLGGLVKPGSLQNLKGELQRQFILTDQQKDILVTYQGSLPDLFREGKGAVITGHFQKNGLFVATQVLAKHDENYMPPKVAKALSKEHA